MSDGIYCTRVCKDCGKVMQNVYHSKIRCPECAKERRYMLTRQYWDKHKADIRSTRKKSAKKAKTGEELDAEFRAECVAADKAGLSYGKYMLRKMQANKKPAGEATTSEHRK